MRKISIFSLIVATLLLIGCATVPKATVNVNAPNQVFINGNIYTENSDTPQAEAFSVKNGKFVFVGSNEDAKRFINKNTKVIDLKGQTVYPSFIDSHTHPGLVAMSAGNGELAEYQLPTTSKEDVYAYLRKIAKEKPDLDYLMIGEWSNPLWGVEDPDRKEIDDIFPKTLVVLLDSSGHSY